jgi:hypothetical protein
MTKENSMTEEEVTLAVIKHEISKLPEQSQTEIAARAQTLRNIAADPNGFGAMAFALVGAELAAK